VSSAPCRSASASRSANGFSPTNTSRRRARNPKSPSEKRVLHAGRLAPKAEPAFAMYHGVRLVVPAEQRGGFSCGAAQLAQRLRAAIGKRRKDGEDGREAQGSAKDLREFAKARERRRPVFQEHPHVRIAHAIGAPDNPAQGQPGRRNERIGNRLARPGESGTLPLQTREEI